MNNENENKNEKTKSSDLVEAETFSQAIASRDEIIAKKNETIKILKSQLGEREKVISANIEEIDKQKTARFEVESQLAEKKELKIEHKGNYYRTEEEKFADSFLKDWDAIKK